MKLWETSSGNVVKSNEINHDTSWAQLGTRLKLFMQKVMKQHSHWYAYSFTRCITISKNTIKNAFASTISVAILSSCNLCMKENVKVCTQMSKMANKYNLHVSESNNFLACLKCAWFSIYPEKNLLNNTWTTLGEKCWRKFTFFS